MTDIHQQPRGTGAELKRAILDEARRTLEAIMLVDGMPKWTPAKQNGKEVNCYITLPVKYGQ